MFMTYLIGVAVAVALGGFRLARLTRVGDGDIVVFAVAGLFSWFGVVGLTAYMLGGRGRSQR